MATTDIGIKLSLQGANEVQSGLDRVGTGLRGMATNAKESVSSVKELALAMGAAFSVKSIIDAADAVTTLRNQLKLATGSASEAKTAYAALFDVAQRARVSFTDLGGTYASLARAGEQLGVSQQRLLGVTEAISNAVTISGGSAESAKAALVQLSQGLASGTLRGDELNSVMEQTPRLASALAAGLGVTTGELRKLGEAGEITADKVIRALESQAGVLKGEVAGSVLTVGQAWQQLQNASVKTIGDFDAATGASSTLASAMQALAGAITTVGQAAREHETATKVFFGLIAGAAVATTVGAIASALGGLVAAIGSIGAAVGTVGAVIAAANPVTLALLGIGAAVGAVAAYSSAQGKNLDTVSQKISDISQEITELDAAIERSKGAKGVLLGNGAVTTKERANDLVADLRKQRAEMQALLAENTAPSASMLLRRIDNQEDAAARAQDKINAEQIEKARALVKTKNAILDAGYKEAVTIAQNYQGAIDAAEKSGDTDKQRELIAQRSALLIASAKETAEAVKSFNERDTATAREAAKERLEVQIAGYERAGQAFDDYQKQQQKSLETAHALGLTSESEYIRAKEQLELGVNQGKQDLAQQELQAVQKSGLLQKDRIAQEQKYTTEIQKLKDQQVQIANDAADAIALAEQKELRAAIDSNAQTVESAQDRASQLQEQLRAQQAANKEIGLSAREVIALRTATAELTATELERRAGLIQDAKPEYAQSLRDQAAAIRGIAAANAEALEKSAAVEQFNRVWESVDRTAHDTFVNIFEGGQDAFTKLRDTLKSTLLDLLYQMTVRKWIFNIVASVTGGATGSVAQQVLGNSGTGSIIGTASNLNSLWGAGSQFFGGTTAGASGASLAYANGVGMIGGDSIGALYSANGGWAGVSTGAAGSGATAAGSGFMGVPVAGWIAMGMMASDQAYSAGFRADASANGMGNPTNPNHLLNLTDRSLQGIGISPRVAAILSGSALGAAAQNFVFGGSGDISALGGGLQGTIGGAGSSLSAYNVYKQDHRGFLGIGSYTTENREYTAASSEVTAFIDSQIKTITDSAKKYGEALGVPVEKIDGFTKQIDVNLTNLDAAGVQKALQDAINGFANDLTNSAFGDAMAQFAKAGESTGTTLMRVTAEVGTVNATLAKLGGQLFDLDAAGIKAADGLVQAMGGLEAFQQQTASYYQNYYTQEEQRQMQAQDIAAKLAASGITVSVEQVLSGTREQFRALVESFTKDGGLMTESGQKAVAALMSVADAFASITVAANTATTPGSTGTTGTTPTDRWDWWNDPIKAAEHDRAVTGGGGGGVSDAVNKALQERTQLQQELDNLTLTSAELLKKQRDALDESNRALFDQVQAAKAAKAAADERKGLQDQYNQLTMTELQLRALERDSIALSNRDLYDRITAIKSAQKELDAAKTGVSNAMSSLQRAVDAEKQSIEAARQAAQERANILGSIVSTLGDAVGGIRGNVESTKAAAAARGNAFITDALATAKVSGYMPDADALKKAISDARAGLDVNNYTSQFEYEKAQLELAGKLDGLKEIADPQLTAAKQSVKVAEDQLKALDAQLKLAQDQIDALDGIDTSVKSVAEAMTALTAAINAQKAAKDHLTGLTGGGGGGTTATTSWTGEKTGTLTNDFWKMWAGHMQNVYGENAGYKVYDMAKSQGITLADLDKAMGWTDGHAKAWALAHGLPAFAVGTNYVPSDMVAQIHEGEAIVPKAYNPAAGGASGNARLESLVEALTAEVQRLQAIVNDGNTHAQRTANAVNGNPEVPMLVTTV